MSRLVSRIMLALLMLPAALVGYVAAGSRVMSTMPRWPPATAFTVAGAVTWLFAALWWVLLWRTAVRWTPQRIGMTVVALPAAGVLGALAAWALRPDSDVGASVGALTAIIAWLTATVFIWRETGNERARRIREGGLQVVVCPRCGYNLTGLRQAACPECGGSWTIEDLMAHQPARQDADL